MNIPPVTEEEMELYRRRMGRNEIDVKRTYTGRFLVTSVFPRLSEEEKLRQRIEITEHILKRMRQG